MASFVSLSSLRSLRDARRKDLPGYQRLLYSPWRASPLVISALSGPGGRAASREGRLWTVEKSGVSVMSFLFSLRPLEGRRPDFFIVVVVK